MKIPKRFKLYNHTVSVNVDPALLHKDDARGMAHYRDSRIDLQPVSETNPHPATYMEAAFCHELVHFLFWHSGYADDRQDEVKVERIAQLLHQALTTMEYE